MTDRRLRELERAEAKLRALENGGVDNWEWYDESLKEFNENEEIEEKVDNLLEEIQEKLLIGVFEPSERGAGFAATNEACEETRKVLIKFAEEMKKYSR